MCPVCIANMALTVAGATSTGGLTALIVTRVRAKGIAKRIAQRMTDRIAHNADQKRSSS